MASRRGLDSERQIKETQEQRARREAQVAQKEAIKTEVFATLRPFYCDVCDKQYANVSQYDEHVRGYAHTHKVVSLNHSILGSVVISGHHLANERNDGQCESKYDRH